MELVKRKLIQTIMTGLLLLAGRICPDFIYALLDEMRADERTKDIINLRYVVCVKFESIPDLMKKRCELRNVFKIHKQFIDHLYLLVISRKNKS